MNTCDNTCTCPLKESCLGRRFPEWSETMRAHWDSGDLTRQNFVIFRSGLPYSPDPTVPSISAPIIPTPIPPRLRDMAVSLAGTLVQEAKHVITGHSALVPEEVFQTRVAICKGEQGDQGRCRFLQESPRLRCLKCGCDGEIAFRLPVKSCPINRWNAHMD